VPDSLAVTTRPPAHLAEYLARAAGERPNHPALVVGATHLTWSELDRSADACAAGLAAAGVAHGDRVGLFLGNRPELVVGYFGVLRAGGVAVPLDPGLTPSEVAPLVAEVGVRLLIVDRRTASTAEAAAAAVPRVVAGVGGGAGSFDALLESGRAAPAPPPPPGNESLAMVIHTSGTSGAAKGAMLTHRALIASIEQVAAASVPVATPDDVVLLLLPLTHVYSLAGTLGALVRAGATGVLTDHTADALAQVEQHGVTNVPGAPALWSSWASDPRAVEVLPRLRIAFSGSAELPPEVQHRVHALTGWFIHEGYGLTEAAPGVSSTVVSGAAKPGSVGRPFPGVEVRLVDDTGELIDPADGDPGEVWIRGANLFSGYWPDGSGGPGSDGWYATGDVAFVDDDGDLHIVDRRKDVIIVSGFNVYPHEVEAVLLLHPGVAEAAVVSASDDRTGEAVMAYVVLSDATVTPEALVEHASARLARFKRPRTIEIVTNLPHSLTGKVVRSRLESASEEEAT
jgi:long-chain acyl-CoA synthetase